jgi:paraquat-inducible protein A
MNRLRACHCCGLIHELADVRLGQSCACTRCGAVIQRSGSAQVVATRTAALALGAFILYWPAVLLPIIEVERLGHRYASSLLMGTIDLFQHGSWFVGTIVLVFSIILPLAKLVLLLELSLFSLLHRRHKAATYRLMEHAGRWGMMDVLLLAFLVMLVKLGSVVTFHLGPAIVAFVLCVVLSMAASLCFDPHTIWEDEAST